jgi:hypothetical protein
VGVSKLRVASQLPLVGGMTERQRKRRLFSLSKRRRITEAGCWEWTGSVSPSTGYGQYRTDTHNLTVHRMAYQLFRGEIQDGFHVHHECQNRTCFNPDHLTVLTPSEHWALGDNPSAKRARQTHCQNGHPFDDSNTWVNKRGHRRCRACHAERERLARRWAS